MKHYERDNRIPKAARNTGRDSYENRKAERARDLDRREARKHKREAAL